MPAEAATTALHWQCSWPRRDDRTGSASACTACARSKWWRTRPSASWLKRQRSDARVGSASKGTASAGGSKPHFSSPWLALQRPRPSNSPHPSNSLHPSNSPRHSSLQYWRCSATTSSQKSTRLFSRTTLKRPPQLRSHPRTASGRPATASPSLQKTAERLVPCGRTVRGSTCSPRDASKTWRVKCIHIVASRFSRV